MGYVLVVPLWSLRFKGGGEIEASEALLDDIVMKKRGSRINKWSLGVSARRRVPTGLVMGFDTRCRAAEIVGSRRVRVKWADAGDASMTGGHVQVETWFLLRMQDEAKKG